MSLFEDVSKQGANAEASLLKLKVQIARGEIVDQVQCQQILQAACSLAIARKDRDALQRNLSQLKSFGPMNSEYFALELLLLLVQSKFADFFSLLESMDSNTKQSNHVEFVVLLERNLTEGSYQKALNARKASTSSLFAWLLEDLENTVREEVASCLEFSYSQGLPLSRATELLQLDQEENMRKFALARGWTVTDMDVVTFADRNDGKVLTKDSLPIDVTIRECLTLALELDRIV